MSPVARCWVAAGPVVTCRHPSSPASPTSSAVNYWNIWPFVGPYLALGGVPIGPFVFPIGPYWSYRPPIGPLWAPWGLAPNPASQRVANLDDFYSIFFWPSLNSRWQHAATSCKGFNTFHGVQRVPRDSMGVKGFNWCQGF